MKKVPLSRSVPLQPGPGTGLFRLAPLALLMLAAAPARAGLWFDPALVSGDAQGVADLSQFEKEGEPAGSYDVSVRINGSGGKRHHLRFVSWRDPSLAGAAVSGAEGDVRDGTGLVACLTVDDLQAMGVRTGGIPALAGVSAGQCVSPGRFIPRAWTAFDFQAMQLDISIPQAYMQGDSGTAQDITRWDEGITAALLNYRLNGSDSRAVYGDSHSYFLSLNSGINAGPWRLRDNSTWQYNAGRSGGQQGWQHLNTWVERDIIPWRSEMVAGDGTTGGEIFDPIGFRGLQLATSEDMYPDAARGYAPVVRGVANSNAQIRVRQSGNIIYQTSVPAGAFSITDLSPAVAGGDLQVSVTEADGSVREFSVPYASVPLLQREGHTRYALTAGRYRNNSSQYAAPAFMQGTLLRGLPYGLTAYGGLQLAQRYRATALGTGVNLGAWGGLSASVTQAGSTLADGSRHQGRSLRLSWSRVFSATGTMMQLAGYRYSGQGFHTLEETAMKGMTGWLYDEGDTDAQEGPVRHRFSDYYDLNNSRREQIQASVFQSLGSSGSLSLTGSRQTYWQADGKKDALQTMFSSSAGRMSYSLSWTYSRESGQTKPDEVLFLSLSLPLDMLSGSGGHAAENPLWATLSASRNGEGNLSTQTGVSGAALEGNNLSWSLSQGYSRQDGNSAGAGLNYQGGRGQASLGYTASRNYRQLNWGAGGSALLHADGLTLGQTAGDTVVLIAAPGAADVPVEGATGNRTDDRGYALRPWASAYRETRAALDVSHLGEHTEIDNPVAEVVPTRGAIVRASFVARTGARVLMNLSHNGAPLPFGATVTDGSTSSIVGDAGEVYLSGLGQHGELHAQWGASPDQQCRVHFRLPAEALAVPLYRTTGTCR